jgi:hypothetical protein
MSVEEVKKTALELQDLQGLAGAVVEAVLFWEETPRGLDSNQVSVDDCPKLLH